MRILFKDEHFVAVDKPAGHHVHPHEIAQHRVPRYMVCLYQVRDLIGQKVYPVHRLDAGTSGVLIFALSSESASKLCGLFAGRTVQKTYRAVVRGYTPEQGVIDEPLGEDMQGNILDCVTEYRRLATREFDVAVSKRFPTSRYSMVEVRPLTGRYHQIRRHMARIAHPLIGDAEHGDSRHNRFFRNDLGLQGLCLRAKTLEFVHPWTEEPLKIEASPSTKWKQLHSIFEWQEPLHLAPSDSPAQEQLQYDL